MRITRRSSAARKQLKKLLLDRENIHPGGIHGLDRLDSLPRIDLSYCFDLKATDIEIGLLVNFGNPKLEYRWFQREKINTKS